MKWVNEHRLETTRSLDYTNRKNVGIVVKTAEELKISNQLGLYIPRFMLNIPFSKAKEESISINYDKIKNHENSQIGETSAKTRNYFKVNCLSGTNTTIPNYALYEKVLVECIDEDIKTLYFRTDFVVNPGKRGKGDYFRIGAISPNLQQKDTDVESSKENFYYMEFDTKNKRIIIQNSAVNGEKRQFTILLDAKNGTLSMTDGERTLNMNANEDRVTLQNKANSIITMEGENINIQCKNLNIEAEESIKMKTQKYKLETNTLEEKVKNAKIEHTKYELTSNSGKENVNSYEMQNLTHKVTVPIVDFQVTGLAVKGSVAATGVSIAPNPPSPSAFPSLPAGDSVSEFGNSTTKVGTTKMNSNFGSVPLVRSPELQRVIVQMCVKIDMALAKGEFPLPPTASAEILPQINSIMASSISGS